MWSLTGASSAWSITVPSATHTRRKLKGRKGKPSERERRVMKIITVPVNEDMKQEGRNEVEQKQFHNYRSKENGSTAYEMNKSCIYCCAYEGQQVYFTVVGKVLRY